MLGAELAFTEYRARLQEELDRIDAQGMQKWSDLIFDRWQSGKFVYIIGNGGSASTASHMAVDLGKSTLGPHGLRDDTKKRLKVLSLTDNVAWLTAVANDLDYQQAFVQQLMNYGQDGDLLIAISGSGNSANVLAAVDWANRNGLTTFALTGFDGGKLRTLVQKGLHVDVHDMGMVESIHLCLFHWALDDVYARINEVGRHATGH